MYCEVVAFTKNPRTNACLSISSLIVIFLELQIYKFVNDPIIININKSRVWLWQPWFQLNLWTVFGSLYVSNLYDRLLVLVAAAIVYII
jgi:hypothetical protein